MRLFVFLIIYKIIIITPAVAYDLKDIRNAIVYDKPKGKLYDEFYPIGFSKNNLFAYVRIPADEAVGCYLWEFKIKNLINDKILFKIGFEHDECDKIKTFNDLSKIYKTNFTNKLYNYGIKISNHKIEKFPLSYKNDSIKCYLKRIKRVKDKNSGYKTIYFVIIKSDLKGKKKIGIVKEINMGTPYIYNSNINGYILSPFEDRLVVVVESEHRGWEGPPNVSTFKLFGSSLKSGFRK